jgi:hypothetical protein
MEHPIKAFIDDLFGVSHSEYMRMNWAQRLIELEYETVEDFIYTSE